MCQVHVHVLHLLLTSERCDGRRTLTCLLTEHICASLPPAKRATPRSMQRKETVVAYMRA